MFPKNLRALALCSVSSLSAICWDSILSYLNLRRQFRVRLRLAQREPRQREQNRRNQLHQPRVSILWKIWNSAERERHYQGKPKVSSPAPLVEKADSGNERQNTKGRENNHCISKPGAPSVCC